MRNLIYYHKIAILGKNTLAILCIHHLDLYWIWWNRFLNNNITAAIVRLFIDMFLLVIVLWIKKVYKNTFKWNYKLFSNDD